MFLSFLSEGDAQRVAPGGRALSAKTFRGGFFPGQGEGNASAKGIGGASTLNSYEIPRGRGIPVPIPGCLATPGGTVVIGDATTVIGVRAGAVGPWADVDRGRGETIAKSRSIAAIISLAIAARWSVVRRPGSWEEGMGGCPSSRRRPWPVRRDQQKDQEKGYWRPGWKWNWPRLPPR